MLPQTMEELNRRVMENNKVVGFGLGTTTVLPCPFCGAADWMNFPVTAGINGYEEQQVPHTCEECGRGAKFIFARSDGGVAMELVQTCGPDVPEWMHPKPRRES